MMLTPLSSLTIPVLSTRRAPQSPPLQLLTGRAGSTATRGRLTRHSTKVTQDGARVIGEDGEVPSVSAEESTGASLTDVEGHCPVPRTRAGASDVTLKTVLIFPPGSRCRGCWCPPCHSARPHGSPSPPRASSTLAAGRGRAVSTISLPVAAGPSSTQRCEMKGPSSPRATATREQGDGAADRRPHAHGHGGHIHSGRLDKHKVPRPRNTPQPQKGGQLGHVTTRMNLEDFTRSGISQSQKDKYRDSTPMRYSGQSKSERKKSSGVTGCAEGGRGLSV